MILRVNLMGIILGVVAIGIAIPVTQAMIDFYTLIYEAIRHPPPTSWQGLL